MAVPFIKYAFGSPKGFNKSMATVAPFTKPKSNNRLLLSPLHSFDNPTIIAFSSNFKLDKRAIFSSCNSTFSDTDMVIFPATIGAKTNCSPSE